MLVQKIKCKKSANTTTTTTTTNDNSNNDTETVLVGKLFEMTSVVPYIMKYNSDPITGAPLSLSSLVNIKLHINSNGKVL